MLSNIFCDILFCGKEFDLLRSHKALFHFCNIILLQIFEKSISRFLYLLFVSRNFPCKFWNRPELSSAADITVTSLFTSYISSCFLLNGPGIVKMYAGCRDFDRFGILTKNAGSCFVTCSNASWGRSSPIAKHMSSRTNALIADLSTSCTIARNRCGIRAGFSFIY